MYTEWFRPRISSIHVVWMHVRAGLLRVQVREGWLDETSNSRRCGAIRRGPEYGFFAACTGTGQKRDTLLDVHRRS